MAPSAPLPLPLAQKPPAPLPLEPSLFARLPGMLMALLMALGLALAAEPAQAALTTNSYDGNIYALYAGNGSLVPPRNNLAQTLAAHRPAALIFYLDDDSSSKQFAPVVSELQRLWGNNIELIPLVSDPLQNRPDAGSGDPLQKDFIMPTTFLQATTGPFGPHFLAAHILWVRPSPGSTAG